ncbi:MAG: right-handed parallel beta-helix repeat-containing protein [Chitinivibrionales bacterium]|nr:right-handed parallel beta-helix repeat-containing protein [Chitinivibrionales bacterium]
MSRNRYHAILVMTVLLLIIDGSTTTYYVANSGSDQADGLSASTPLATLSYSQTKMKNRDTLLLRRADIFRDSLKLTAVTQPVIAAYGSLQMAHPIISGSTQITGWSPYQGNIWSASCDKKIEKLFVDNFLQTLARYPDTGWLRIDTMSEDGSGEHTIITVASLCNNPNNAPGYWNNSQIRWRRWSWWYETRRIQSYAASGALSLEGKSVIHITGTKGWGFYIDNKFKELTVPGEWYYDSSAKKVYLYPPDNINPNKMVIEGSFIPAGVVLSGGTVTDICFRHQNLYGISTSGQSTIERCRFEWIGGDQGGSAIRATWDVADSRVRGNYLLNNLNSGILWYENSGRKGMTVIEQDTLLSTGVFPGLGGTGTWHGVGILVHLSTNVRVQCNYLDKVGYAGILLGSDSNFVQYNVIKNAMYTFNDGGAIYTDCSKSYIRNNIIIDTKGDLSSCGPWYPLGHGIWLEFLGDFRESVVENNTVIRSGCYGLYLPNNFSCTIKDNCFFDNAVAQFGIDGDTYKPENEQQPNLPQNNQILGNILYACSRSQKTLLYRPEFNYGTLQNNYFCNPYTDSVVSGYGVNNQKWTVFDYPLAVWKPMYSWTDKSAKTDPIKRSPNLSESNPYGKGKIFTNPSSQSVNIGLGTTAYVDLEGSTVSGSITVPPFSSKIVVQVDSTSGIKKPFPAPALVRLWALKNGLRYDLSAPCAVTLRLYSMTGRKVIDLKKEHGTAGSYKIDFAAVRGGGIFMAQGVYALTFTLVQNQRNSSYTLRILVSTAQ